jgi:hypothetical protein
LVVVKIPEAKRGFVLLPKRWVGERRFAWTARYRRLACDCERLAAVPTGLHFLVFACLMLHEVIHFCSSVTIQVGKVGCSGHIKAAL